MLPRTTSRAMCSRFPSTDTPNRSHPAARIIAACNTDKTSADSTRAAKKTRTFNGVARIRMRIRFSRYAAIEVAIPMTEKFITPQMASPGIRKSK